MGPLRFGRDTSNQSGPGSRADTQLTRRGRAPDNGEHAMHDEGRIEHSGSVQVGPRTGKLAERVIRKVDRHVAPGNTG